VRPWCDLSTAAAVDVRARARWRSKASTLTVGAVEITYGFAQWVRFA
jgi:hypothetical protein